MTRKALYLTLCLIGLVVPYIQFVPWALEHGLDMRLFADEMWANPISRFFVLDVVVSAIVVTVFLRLEKRALRIRGVWLVPLALLTVGVSLGLPLFLYLRQCAIEEPAG